MALTMVKGKLTTIFADGMISVATGVRGDLTLIRTHGNALRYFAGLIASEAIEKDITCKYWYDQDGTLRCYAVPALGDSRRRPAKVIFTLDDYIYCFGAPEKYIDNGSQAAMAPEDYRTAKAWASADYSLDGIRI